VCIRVVFDEPLVYGIDDKLISGDPEKYKIEIKIQIKGDIPRE
jgi:hypothetical protein